MQRKSQARRDKKLTASSQVCNPSYRSRRADVQSRPQTGADRPPITTNTGVSDASEKKHFLLYEGFLLAPAQRGGIRSNAKHLSALFVHPHHGLRRAASGYIAYLRR
jgi:hypothetical protein